MMIIVEDLVKKYGDFTVLDGLNFTVEDSDVFAFLGPNGAGKTTTIRILTAMIKTDSGNVIIDGYDVFKESLAVRSVINALPESTGYYEWMTAAEYLDFFFKLYDRKTSKKDACDLLEAVGLSAKRRGHGFRSTP